MISDSKKNAGPFRFLLEKININIDDTVKNFENATDIETSSVLNLLLSIFTVSCF